MAGEPLVHVDETAPLRPDSPAPYSATKARAELAVRRANRDGFETVAVRPRFVWGKGDTTLLPEMVATVEAGDWPGSAAAATSPTPPTSTTSSRGCSWPPRGARPGEAYFVTDGEPVVFREFVSAMLETQGVEPPDRSLSRPGRRRRWRAVSRGRLEAAAAPRRAADDDASAPGS